MSIGNKIRLQKVIAESGRASRREAEQWIREGRITVNGERVTEMGQRVDPKQDRILVDGEALTSAPKKRYYIFHKPRNVLVARRDPRGRPVIYDYLKRLPVLVHPAGRLDFDSEGLLLLTNDGPLIHRLTHPSSKFPKTYHVKVKQVVTEPSLRKLRCGVKLEDGLARAISAKIISALGGSASGGKVNQNNCWLEIVITEGRNRQIRRMCEAIGYPALRLRRMAIGNLKLGKLGAGDYRELTAKELKGLSR